MELNGESSSDSDFDTAIQNAIEGKGRAKPKKRYTITFSCA